MPIIFSDANAYQPDLGPSEGDMFFTNLLSGLQQGIERRNAQTMQDEQRRRGLADQIAAEERQYGRQVAQEGRMQGYLRESENRQERRNLEVQARRQLERDQERQQQLEDESRRRQESQQDWADRGGQETLAALRQEREQKEVGRVRGDLVQQHLGNLGGINIQPDAIESSLQEAQRRIDEKAATILNPQVRAHFYDEASKRLGDELGRLQKIGQAKRLEQQQREEVRRTSAGESMKKTLLEGGLSFIPSNQASPAPQSFLAQESALKDMLRSGAITMDEFYDEISTLLDSYRKYSVDEQSRAALESHRRRMAEIGRMKAIGSAAGTYNFDDTMRGQPVRDVVTGEQITDYTQRADAWLNEQLNQ